MVVNLRGCCLYLIIFDYIVSGQSMYYHFRIVIPSIVERFSIRQQFLIHSDQFWNLREWQEHDRNL